MTIFNKFQQISAKTKILLFALLMIILPSGYLGYLGYRSLEGRELRLKNNYAGLTRIMRDQLEGKIKNLEDNFINESAAFDWPLDSNTIQNKLEELRGQHPIIDDIFIGDAQGTIIHPDVFLLGSSFARPQNVAAEVLDSAPVTTGERYEFIENDYPQALDSYRRAMEQASSPQARAYTNMLIARCLFKMREFSQAAEHYSNLAKTNSDVTSEDGTPLRIIGLSQLADCYSRLAKNEDQFSTLLLMYQELISTPLAFDSYEFYLQNMKDDFSQFSQQPSGDESYRVQLDKLEAQERELNQTIGTLETARAAVLDQINKNSSFSREIIQDAGGDSFQIGSVAIPSSNAQIPKRQLVYTLNPDYVLGKVLTGIGGQDDLGSNLRVGIVSEEDSLAFPPETPDPSLGLADEKLVQFFPWWRLVIFDTKGKTVEKIIGREKFLYGGALLGVFILILGGAGLTLRAAVHEAEAARIKSEFVSNVSHELKTPLALIRLFGETLEMGEIQDEKKRKKFSQIITRETKRLSHLVENVLDFSRIDAGRKEYNFEEADIVQVVSRTLEAYRYYLKDQKFEFMTSIPDKPILMRIDKDGISQALLNLVSNAEKFSGDQKYIGVTMIQRDGEVWIDVVDKGPGIPGSRLKQIFEKFDRGGGELAREVQGSGLGLTIAKHIIESHGGRIDVESRVGEGSHFILKLPLKREQT
jgi:signal transduction histidine kinase/tetratricopeptide (TPR) repeat protein